MSHRYVRSRPGLRWSAALAFVLGAVSCTSATPTKDDDTDVVADTDVIMETVDYVDIGADGILQIPTGYREWVFVGEPVTPNELNDGKAAFPEMHAVYIDPTSYAAWAATGEFPDGTVLIKELTNVGATQASSGNGFFMGDYVGLEATIKSAEHFPDEPGNWAYYSFTNPTGGGLSSTATPFPTASCNGCHAANAADDFVFTQYYPVLREASTEEMSMSDALFQYADGVLQRPVGYRQWVFVGGPLTPNDLNGGAAPFPEFHNVYIDPDSYEHLQTTGEFREGTILIKELVAVGTTAATSGSGYFMGDFIGLEATIKSADLFPDEPGNWAYFSFTDEAGGAPNDDATPFATSSCNSCHANNAADDFVFTQYYPVLRDAIAQSQGESLVTSNVWQPTLPHQAEVDGVPLDRAPLHEWLQSGAYVTDFSAQHTETVPGRGPHTMESLPIKAYFNDILAASYEAGNVVHPAESLAVKEMHTTDGTLMGWAVMAKLAGASDAGGGWFWYESISVDDPGAVVAAGAGVPGCIGCHSVGGTDLILSDWPLE